jgi:hypothetical protein
MATYVNNLRLTELATGEGSGTWGTTTNTNLELIGEALGHGSETIANASTHTITVADGTSDSARSFYLICAGGGQACTVTLAPNTLNKVWMIENTTSYTLTFSQGSGANVAVAAGQVKMIATNGAGAGAVVYDLLTDVDLTGTTTAVNVSVSGTLGVTGVLTATSLDISGDIDVDGTTNLDVVDIDGAVNMATTALVTGVLTTTATQVATGGITSGSNIVSDTDSTDDLGTTSVRWANLFVDGITATDQITATGFTGTLDGILGSGAAAAATVTTLDTSGAVNLNLVTDSSSSTSGALIVDGGVGIAKKLYVGTDLDVDGTTNLDVVDIDGAVNMATTALVTGVLTTTATQVATGGITSGSDIISDTDSTDSLGSTGVRWLKGWFDTLTAGTLTIGSGSVTDSSGAISFGDENLTTTGIVTAAGTSVFTNLDISGDIDVDGTTNLDVVDIDGAVDFGSTTAHAGNATFADNAKAIFGAGSDLQIYHDGTDSYITDTTGGNFFINDDGLGYLMMKGSDLYFRNPSNADMIHAQSGGFVKLYHNGGEKLTTTATGIDVTGISVSDGMSTNTLGTSNLRLGVNAGNSIASGGNYNTVVGDEAGTAITTGDQNVAVGFASALNTTTATNNTALGYYSLYANTTGTSNVAVGANALDANTTASNNTAVGKDALTANTTGANNVAVGAISLDANTTGAQNTAIGRNSLSANTTSDNNTAVGHSALAANTTAESNTAVGKDSLVSNTTGPNNVAVGFGSLQGNTTGISNSAFGTYSLKDNTTGNYNTALGGDIPGGTYGSLSANTTGSSNVAVGTAALRSNTTASNNTAVGYRALDLNTTGAGNTAIGQGAGDAITTASYNVAVGSGALSATCGNSNVAVGVSSAISCTGAGNTAIGTNAGYGLTSGGNNTLLGADAGRTGSPGGNITTQSNLLVLADENITNAYIQVDWTVASDARDKTDFTALDLGLDFVKDLQPVTYKWDKRSQYGDKTADDYDLTSQTPDGTHKEDWLDIGFKAQEVEALEIAAGYNKDNKTNLVSSHSDDGKQMGLQYSKFVPILVKAIQEQNALIEALTARITTLEG